MGGEGRGLFDPHAGAGHAGLLETGLGQALGEGLDQVDMAGVGDGAGELADGLVIDGVANALAVAGGDVELDIDDQRLAGAVLVVIDADTRLDLQAAHEHHGDDDPGRSGPGRVVRSGGQGLGGHGETLRNR